MRLRVDWRSSCSLVGSVLQLLAIPLLAPLLLAMYQGTDVVPFLVTTAVSLYGGTALTHLTDDRQLHVREAFLMVALTWLAVALVGAVPFVLAGSGVLSNPVNALFESMSGVTTTGATVLVDFDAHSRPVLLWRQLIQWLGGLGILVLATAILSNLSVAGAQLMETETQMGEVTRLTPRISETARILWSLYAALTILGAAALYALGPLGLAPEMTAFDALSHSLTGISTSGFSPRAESVGAFSPAAQWVVVWIMALGATNFVLIYAALRGDFDRLLDSEEFRFYVGLIVGLSGVLLAVLVAAGDFVGPTESAVRHAVFQVVSVLTTTGFATVDFDLWSEPAKHVLFACMFVGGMAGSTTCSIKTLRWLVIVKAFDRDLYVAATPEAVRPVRLGGEPIDESTIRDVYAYTLVSLAIFFVVALALGLNGARTGTGVTEFEALSASAATFFNVGPAFGRAGPYGTYESFSTASKLLMTALMWVGRIEVIPVLVLLKRSFWVR